MKSYGYARDNEQRGGQNRPNQFQDIPERGKEEDFFQKNSKTIVIASVAVATVSTAALVKTLYDNAVRKTAGMRTISKYLAEKEVEKNKQKQKEEPAVESEETKK